MISPHPHINEAKQIAEAMSIGRPSPKLFLQHRALVITLDYEPPSIPPKTGDLSPQARNFIAKVECAMQWSWRHVTVGVGEPLLQGDRMTQIIVFGITPEVGHSIGMAFPEPPKGMNVKTNWSYPMRYRDLSILWK